MFKKQIIIKKRLRLRSFGKGGQGKKPGPDRNPLTIPVDALRILVRVSADIPKGKPATTVYQVWESMVANALENQTEEWAQNFLDKISPEDISRGSQFLREKKVQKNNKKRFFPINSTQNHYKQHL